MIAVNGGRMGYRKSGRYPKYGLESHDVRKMLAHQDGKCPGCGEDITDDYVIDHDHDGGFGNKFAVRGLLCAHCNKALNHRMTPSVLRALAEYLERFELGKTPPWFE